MALSIFTDKTKPPDNKKLSETLNGNFKLWNELKEFVINEYPEAVEEWKFAGKSFGWGYRLKDKKRVIVYMTPCEKYFLVSFVLGEKATNEALSSKISREVKDIISASKVYAEGRGVRLELKERKQLGDIKSLVKIKISN